MRIAQPIMLTDEERNILTQWSRGRRTPTRLVLRAKIVLLAASGMQNKQIAPQVKTDRFTVARWRSRFAQERLAGIEKDAPRSGRKATRRNQVTARIIERTTQTRPANATHWSVRTLAKELNVSESMVHRVWKANNLKPHLSRTFKLSNDPRFVEKVIDVVGLYLNPPEHALVLCVDEKSQIQALDRTQPGLPIKKGRCGTMTHDYKRNGTTCLFAALNVLAGKVIGSCYPRHRNIEFLKFLRKIDRETPRELAIHMILDNYGTHNHPNVKAWLAKHPRFHLHFTPTSSSWLNLVERWFGGLTNKRLRRGVFRSVEELVAAIEDYIRANNEEPKPFVWTKKVEDILAKVAHCKAVSESLH
jgi:transposase